MPRFFPALLLASLIAVPAAATTKAPARPAPHPAAKAMLKSPARVVAKAPAKAPAPASGLAAAFAALDRGQAGEAISIANRAADQTMADAVRGEAYAQGAPATLGELYAFLGKYPDWPQRNAIMAAAESRLSADTPYPPLLKAYSIDSQPVTTQGFNAWVATLKEAGHDSEVRQAVRARWQSAKLAAGQEDDFRYRYGGYLSGQDDLQRRDGGDSDAGIRWKDTHVQIRDELSQRQWRDAYALAAQHGITAGREGSASEYATAEFLAGWLALRHLQQPQRALAHFQHLYDNVKTPVSKSRGAYWLGRTYEAMGNLKDARKWYEEGASYPTFFYGQLSVAKLNPQAALKLPAEPAVPAAQRSAFERQPLVHIIRGLAAMGQDDRATRFLRALAAGADSRTDFVLADDLARALNRPYLEVVVTKAANQKNYMLGQRGFPLLALARGDRPETALALGIIRQESEFRSDAQSQAGAMGLMQLLPSTAAGLAKRAGMPFQPRDLMQPTTNVRLGREYLGDRIDEFNGSYILAIAAYNAGRGRVKEWLEVYGDPRNPRVDPIDWIELIPIYETRNYVQRVLENTNVYRARLADALKAPAPPLGIVADLTR